MEDNEINENSDSDNKDAAQKPSVNELSSIQHDNKVELFTSTDGKLSQVTTITVNNQPKWQEQR
jgi:hypothetical protein